jgi:hypothetical protein
MFCNAFRFQEDTQKTGFSANDKHNQGSCDSDNFAGFMHVR